MTVALEVAAPTHRAEYILFIEGVGWPVDDHDLSLGFQGTAFSTGDLDGNLASLLTGLTTLHVNLTPPTSLSEGYNPRTLKYQPGTISFELRETALNYLLSTFNPLLTTGKAATLQANLAFNSLEVRIDEASTTFATGDVIWVAGREAIKLGTRTLVAGTVYRYPSSTRGYVGTPRGRYDPVPTGLSDFTWESSTAIHSYNRYWFDRRVLFYMHIPGEVATNLVRLGAMRLRTPRVSMQGIKWTFPTSTDSTGLIPTKIRDANAVHTLLANEFLDLMGRTVFSPGPEPNTITTTQRLVSGLVPSTRRAFRIESSGGGARGWSYQFYSLGYQYAYRNRVTGGTAGVATAIDANPNIPQAAQETVNSRVRYMMSTLMLVGNKILRALYKNPSRTGSDGTRQSATVTSSPVSDIVAECVNLTFDNDFLDLFADGIPIKFLLDNYADTEHNRFRVNNSLDCSTNPIGLLLTFLTTCNNEFYIGDTAAGSTSSAIEFTAPGWTTSQWVGYALHCVEGTNLGEARVITANDAETITVSPAFTNAPAAGAEYQIRNSIYDVLPLGWGLGIHNKDIDIESFEKVRDHYLGGSEIGRFALGDKDRINLWQLLQENICVPYGILTYLAIGNGKLTARYVGSEVLQDLLDETYIAVTAAEIIELGDIDWIPRAPVGQIDLKVRNARTTIIGASTITYMGRDIIDNFEYGQRASFGPGSEAKTITIRSEELDDIFVNTDVDSIVVSAMFNSTLDCAPLVSRLTGKLKREAQPPPECTITLPLKFLVGTNAVQPGALISITDTTVFNPVNPYTGTRGWSGLICRVLGTTFSFASKALGIKCKIQLLATITAGKIAPAAITTAIAGTVATLATTETYVNEVGKKDWYGLAVDDRIELRDQNGALKEGPRVISSFGANLATTPEAASTAVINVTVAWTVAWAAADYITLSPWSGSNTTNMNTYAAYAAATGLYTGGASARRFG